MKRKALKIKLLFILFTISCLSAFSQPPQLVQRNVRDVWFPALKAQTDGDNWTIKTMDDLLGRNADTPPFFKKGTRVQQQDLTSIQQRRPVTLEIVDLSNNNLTGEINNIDQMTWTWLDTSLSTDSEVGRFYRNTSFRFSHNKLTTVRAKLTYNERNASSAQDLWFDHNLLTTFEPIVNDDFSSQGIRGATNSVRINNNQLKGIPASWTGNAVDVDKGGLHFVSNSIAEFRAENNFFNFTDLIKLMDLIHKKRNAASGKNNDFALTIAPQNPLGEENTAKTVAEGDVVELVFDSDKTHTKHRNNVYSWQLNGKDIPSKSIHSVSMGVFTAGVYRCKITNPEILDLTLYSRDFPVFMTKAGNQDPTDLTLDNASAPANLPTDAIIGTFSGTDADNDDLYFRLYNILGDNSSFRIIDGNTLVSATSLFEYSYQQSYILKVEAYDIYGGTFQKDITITRGAVVTGEFPTNIKLSSNTIAENTADKVGDIQLVGANAAGFTYALIADVKDNALFEVVGAALHVKDGLNFEQKKVYTARLKVTNTDGISLTKDFLIHVTNENDLPGNLFITNSQVMIGQASGTLVGTLYATDDDPEDDNFTFAVAENNFFTIVRKKQVVTKKQFIDSDAATKDLTVTVTDAKSGEQTFTLSIEITSGPATPPPIDDGTDAPEMPNNAPTRSLLFGEKVQSIADRVTVEQCFDPKTYDLDTYFQDSDGDVLYYNVTSTTVTEFVSISLKGRNMLVLKELPPATKGGYSHTITLNVDDHKGGTLSEPYQFELKVNEAPIATCICRSDTGGGTGGGGTGGGGTGGGGTGGGGTGGGGTGGDDDILGLVEEERLPASIYPVPVQDLLHIALDKPTSGTVNIRIQSLSGRQVYAKSFAVTSGQTVKQIEVNNLYAGMYLVIVSSNDFVQKFKMLKQ